MGRFLEKAKLIFWKSSKSTKKERPIVAQFFGPIPIILKKAAAWARELGFDGIDINMGCPDRSVTSQGRDRP